MKFVLKFLGNKRKLNLIPVPRMFVYPGCKRVEVVDDYFGTKVADPYRWLEDAENVDAKLFVDQQNAITDQYVKSCPYREAIRLKIVDLWDYHRFGVPKTGGDLFFQLRNSGLENQDVLFSCGKLGEEGQVVVDPNQLSSDGSVGIGDFQIAENCEVLAYMLCSKVQDWSHIKFKNLVTGEDYEEVLDCAKFSLLSWLPDSLGLIYSASESKLQYHKLGTQATEDQVLVEIVDHTITGLISDCGKYLLVFATNLDQNLVFYSELPTEITGKLELTPLVEKSVGTFKYLTNNGTQFLFLTDKSAPNWRIISIDLGDPNEDNWKIFVPEEQQRVLMWGKAIDKDKLILCYMKDVKEVLQLHDVSTGQKLHDIQVGLGCIETTTGRRQDSQLFYSFTSLIKPSKICKINFAEDEAINETVQDTTIKNDDDYELKQVFYKSKDGQNISMFLVHQKNLQLTGQSPCLLYGYGGFGVPQLPKFNLAWMFFVRHFKGIFALANIRGGGEYGNNWHSAGRWEKKQTTFEDFEYAAHYLVGCGYTCSEKLVIEGGEHGGLVVAACINQTPHLFKGAIAHSGIMDVLRFHKFKNGSNLKSEFGTSEDEKMFPHLLNYSPLHNVTVPKTGQYPATLLLTGENKQIPALHSLKYISELQHQVGSLENQKNPLLIRVDVESGTATTTAQEIDRLTDVFCFISNALNLPFYE